MNFSRGTLTYCIEEGEIKYQCWCNSIKIEKLEKEPHNFIHLKILKETNCLNKGRISYECSNCNYSYTDYTIALGHELEKIEVSSYSNMEFYKCKFCDYIEKRIKRIYFK